jgi:hypothetical protein
VIRPAAQEGNRDDLTVFPGVYEMTFEDTTPEALAKQFEVLRRIGPAGRAAMTFELSDNLRCLVEAGVRHRHPQWDDPAVEREVVRLMIGDDLFQRAYGKGRVEP